MLNSSDYAKNYTSTIGKSLPERLKQKLHCSLLVIAVDWVQCSNFFVGTVSRDCSAEVTWEDPNFVDCSSSEFILLRGEVSIY